MAGKPKPTNLKIIEGNRGRRKLPDEPKPRPIAPKAPSKIDSGARKLWKDLAPKIERLGLLTEVDIQAFTALCQAWARLQFIWSRLKICQKNLKLNNGNIESIEKELSYFMKEERLYMQVFRMNASEFGLTPRGRAGLSVGSYDEEEGADLLT